MKVTGITFTQGHTIVAKLISLSTKKGPSHVVVHITNDYGGSYIFHSTSGGVKKEDAGKWIIKKKHSIVSHYEVIDTIDHYIVDNVISKYLGTKYGYLELIGNGFSRLLNKLTFNMFKFRNIFRRHTVCSELAYILLKTVEGFDRFDPNMVSPKDLEDTMKTMPDKFTRRDIGYAKSLFDL